MKALNNKEFSNMGNRIKDTRKALADLQENMRDYRHDPGLFDVERSLKRNWRNGSWWKRAYTGRNLEFNGCN